MGIGPSPEREKGRPLLSKEKRVGPSYLKIISLVSKIKDSLPGLYGFVGVDIMTKGKDMFIIEINPRLTTSFIGIYDTIGVNIIDLIISRKSLKNIISGKKYYINNHE